MDVSDHRSLGRRLKLFHQQDEGPGMVFWHPRGVALCRIIEDYIRRAMADAGFAEVRTPQLLARSLWEQSGHWDKFGANMFSVMQDGADGHRVHALKPMSCPGHIQIFNAEHRSFRDLPLRFAEFGACHRNEPSGALAGLMRTRAFTQDDAHIFCSEAQIVPEVAAFCELLFKVYRAFGFEQVHVGFSTRPAVRAGSDEVWDWAETALAQAAAAAGLAYVLQPGEGAFYGPKLEFVLQDRRGRKWQCGTIQLDLVLPERLDAVYIASDNSRRRPVLIHHAVLGSIERFVALLLEETAGRLPVWLAPEQLVVASVAPEQHGACRSFAARLRAAGLRPRLDLRDERIGQKVADAYADAVPLFAAIGAREAAADSVALRSGDGAQQVMPSAEALGWLQARAAVPQP
jgi:threonyl-tRNA synthetase